LDQFTYVKRGYDPEEVDKYITTLEQVIKSYKDKDNAIKNAIISAQVAADNVVRNAQMHADAYKVQISEQLVEIRATLDRQRMSLQAFQESYANMVRRCIQELEQSSMSDLFNRLEEMETAISDLQGLEAVASANQGHISAQGQIPAAAISGPSHGQQAMQGNHGRSDYLGQDMATREYTREAERDIRPREYEPAPREHDYSRDTPPYNPGPNMRDSSREDIREVMRGQGRDTMQRPIHETLFDTERDIPQQAYQPEPHQDRRDNMRSRDMMAASTHPAYDPPDMMRGRDTAPPHPSYDPHSHERDMYSQRDPAPIHPAHTPVTPPPNADYGRESMQNWDAYDTSRDFTPEPHMRREAQRDTRMDAGRDIRDQGRDVRRDQGRDMMRPPERDSMRPDTRPPMQDTSRPYMPMPEVDSYGDNDQNLLPPVASLM